MNSESNFDKLKELLGDFLISFGSLETQIIYAILIIIEAFKGKNTNKGRFGNIFWKKIVLMIISKL